MATRYLALDIGDKRTGMALGDDITRIVTPVGALHVPLALDGGAALARAIHQAAREHLGEHNGRLRGELVLGLPLNMDGTESGMSRRVRALSSVIAPLVGVPIHFQDERLSTEAARADLGGRGLTHAQKKDRKDAAAAAVILADFLAAGAGHHGPDSGSILAGGGTPDAG